MLEAGYGITNFVNRTTATAAELGDEEIRAGGLRLIATAERYRPRFVAVLGVTSYRIAFGRPKAMVGPLTEVFAELRAAVEDDIAEATGH